MSGAGAVYAQFLAAELLAERARRAALDQRGIAAVTSSGTLVALLAGLATLVALDKGRPAPGGVTLIAFSCAVLCFLVAAYFGLLTNRSREYDVLDEGEGLGRLQSEEVWNETEEVALLVVFRINRRVLATLRSGNDRKSRLVNRALTAQLTALTLLTVAAAASAVQVMAN